MKKPEVNEPVSAVPTFSLNRVTRRRIFGAAAGSVAIAAGARPSHSFNYAAYFINLLLTQLAHGRSGRHIDSALLLVLLQILVLVALRFSIALHGRFPHWLLSGQKVSGGAQVEFTTPESRALAEQIYRDSLGHVRVLRAALRRSGVPLFAMPSVDLGSGFSSESEFFSESFIIIAIILALFVTLLGSIHNRHLLRVLSRLLGSYGSFSGALGTRSGGAQLESPLPTDADGLVGEITLEQAIAGLSPYFPNGLTGLSPDKFEQIKRSRG